MTTRVLILSSQPAFGQGVEAWLRQQKGLDVVGWEAETGTLVERIEQLRPDAIIVDTGTSDSGPVQALMRFLGGQAGATIIAVNLHDNSVCIYNGERHASEHVKQLLEAIGDALSSS